MLRTATPTLFCQNPSGCACLTGSANRVSCVLTFSSQYTQCPASQLVPHTKVAVEVVFGCIHSAQNPDQLWVQDAAELLAAKADWGPLYDSAVLGKNQVPVASATYFEVISLYPFFGRSNLHAAKLQLQQPVDGVYTPFAADP